MDPGKANRSPEIGDFGMIGDTRTAALISSGGSLDWCCLPDFDSPAVFCRILDTRKGGFFRISAVSGVPDGRAYLGDSNILAQNFRSGTGRFRVIDFMPMDLANADSQSFREDMRRKICRLVEGLEGETMVEAAIHPTFGFASGAAMQASHVPGGMAFQSEEESLHLRSPFQMKRASEGWVGQGTVAKGQRLWFVLEYGATKDAEADSGDPSFDPESALRATADFWTSWSSGCTYEGPYRSQVIRSALILKMLTYGPTGAMVAAPTTSIPESPDGGRNWDYRYCWLRDSALILNVFHAIGYGRDAVRFFGWLKSVGLMDKHPLAPFYTIRGSEAPKETVLSHLEGFRGAGPVVTGNRARDQLQLDAYGEIIDAVHMCYTSMDPPHPDLGREVSDLADRAASRWREPDHGIWEFPAGPKHFLHSKLSCWVALDRAIKLSEMGVLGDIPSGWKTEREALREYILSEGFDATEGAFIQAVGEKRLDAAVLAIPLADFLPPDDPRVRDTVARLRAGLMQDGYLRRYSGSDGIETREGSFLLVNFWLVSVLCLQGEWDEAIRLFERLLGTCNDLGLLAEEVDPRSGAAQGNFPQGISHLGLIRAVLHLRDRPGGE